MFNNKKYKSIFSYGSGILVLFALFYYISPTTKTEDSSKLILEESISNFENIDTSNELSTLLIDDNSGAVNLLNDEDLKDTVIQILDPVIPIYTIERVETISGSFNQGRLYVTVDKNHKSNDLLSLCELLKDTYSNFSNVVICIYSNNDVGKILSLGQDINVNSSEIRDNWLAMYTYNEVEGTYFNDNPGGYIGAF